MSEDRVPEAAKPTLLLLTESWPYDLAREDTFLAPQLPYLERAFERVIVIPSFRGGGRFQLPNTVEIDESLADLLARNSTPLALIRRAFASRLTYRDIRERPSVLTSRQAMKLLIRTTARAELTNSWFRTFLPRTGLRSGDCVAYTFWFDHSTVGLALKKSSNPGLLLVARANGADLFLERHEPPYLPCRRFSLEHLDRLFAASEHAMRYAMERYPWFDACEVARLGVLDPGFESPAPSDGRCVIVSCSGIVPVKRIDLILEGVGLAALRKPGVAFEWIHFGDGPLRLEIAQRARATLPANVTTHFRGHQTTAEILRFYRETPVAAFINASSSEGGAPVAIMEAASCGIPIIATAVGGNREIVSDRNGWLVGSGSFSEGIADALTSLIDRPDEAKAKRLESRRVWQSEYQAAVNFPAFARRLVQLREALR